MRLFVVIIIVATVIGGFVGGELMDLTFSLTGAVIGGGGLAGIMLGLGAYFDAQDKKTRKEELTPEIRAVFDRMLGRASSASDNPPLSTQSSSTNTQDAHPKGNRSRSGDDNHDFFLSTVKNLLSVQLLPKYSNIKLAYSILMTNKRAAGYVFGFHDSLIQRLGLYDPSNKDRSAALLEQSYKGMFGEQAGFLLYSMSLQWQDDSTFLEGRMNGGNEILDFIDKNVPPLGLGRILILGMEA